MKKRTPAAVVVLSLLTFGLYAYYWLYQTTRELAGEAERDDIRPGMDLLLTFLTFGFYGIWVARRNATIAHELLLERGEAHESRAFMVTLIGALTVFGGWPWLVVLALLSDDYQRLAAPPDYFRPARRVDEAEIEPGFAASPPRVRVSAPPTSVLEEEPAFARSSEVFESSAPAPNVY